MEETYDWRGKKEGKEKRWTLAYISPLNTWRHILSGSSLPIKHLASISCEETHFLGGNRLSNTQRNRPTPPLLANYTTAFVSNHFYDSINYVSIFQTQLIVIHMAAPPQCKRRMGPCMYVHSSRESLPSGDFFQANSQLWSSLMFLPHLKIFALPLLLCCAVTPLLCW